MMHQPTSRFQRRLLCCLAQPREEEDSFDDMTENLNALQDLLAELEDYDIDETNEDDDDTFLQKSTLWHEETLEELFRAIPEEEEEQSAEKEKKQHGMINFSASLENALLQGVVPAAAGVGSSCLPGDFGFDPLELAKKDYFRQFQSFLIDLLPAPEMGQLDEGDDLDKAQQQQQQQQQLLLDQESSRPQALILRDYREAEIRHGRLAMIAVIFWPLQEKLDQLLLDDDQFESIMSSLFNGGVTLPYFPLLMTLIMLLLGYLDIYSQAVKDMDRVGEAFLPGDCFWDPLSILKGAPDSMARNMQERELFNGRSAMVAFAAFVWEESTTGLPLISIPGNELLLEPAYQIPFIQGWLDDQFANRIVDTTADMMASNVVFSTDLDSYVDSIMPP